MPRPTPAQVCTAASTPGKSPRFVGKGKTDKYILHQTDKYILWAFPEHSILFGLYRIPAGQNLEPLMRPLDPGGTEPALHPGILSQVPSWSQRRLGCPTWLPVKA